MAIPMTMTVAVAIFGSMAMSLGLAVAVRVVCRHLKSNLYTERSPLTALCGLAIEFCVSLPGAG